MKIHTKRKNIPKCKFIILSNELISSEAYWNLTGNEKNVLHVFYSKRKLIEKRIAEKARIRMDSANMVRNNREIVFTYKEAEGYEISNSTFTRCIDKLISHGFIDIAEDGGNSKKALYAISDRWMKFGNPDYKTKTRKKLVNQRIGLKTRFKEKNINKNTPANLTV